MSGRKVRIIPLEPKIAGESLLRLAVILVTYAVLAAAGIALVVIEASS